MRQLVYKVRITCGELTLHRNTVNYKDMSVIVHYNLDFHKHINEKISKAQKEISVHERLYNVLLRNALLAMYKSFFRRI